MSINNDIGPWGCSKLLEWLDRRYEHPQIVMTENGCSTSDVSKEEALEDALRRQYHRDYLAACHEAIQNGVDLAGYFAWSFMDNFEWALGFSARFGLVYVDFDTCERVKKASARWYGEVMRNNGF